MNRREFLRTAGGAAGGTAALAASGSATAAEEDGGGGGSSRPEWPSYVDDANDRGYEDLRGESEVTVTVDSNYFDPTLIWVDPGTTITWEFQAPGHNVKFESQPDGASLEGTPGGDLEPVDEGTTHEVTPDTGGIYAYYCGPHETMGMKGAIAVGDDVPTVQPSAGGGGEQDPEHMGVPFQAHFVGIATLLMLAVSFVFTFFFLKYGESAHTKGGNT